MSLETSHIVLADRELVWRWHNQPGAVARLNPPFFPMTPKSVADNLADGTTIFSLPAGLRWESRHDLSGYVKGYRFTDVCIASPIKAFSQWRHVHSFASHPEGTKVTDEIITRMPKSTLIPMVAYRQQQLIRDFAFATELQRRFPTVPLLASDQASAAAGQLTVAITGSRSTTGRALAAQLRTLGHRVIQLVRPGGRKSTLKPHQRLWDPSDPDPDLLQEVDALVHLAGESLFAHSGDARKRDALSERLEPTRQLARLVAASPRCQVLLAASAIGAYGHDRGEERLTEDSDPGNDQLADLVHTWEAALHPAAEAGTRVVQVRTGVVLSGEGGSLPVLRTLFAAGLGGTITNREDWFSWISLDDLTDIYVSALYDERYSGPINAVAPQVVRTNELASALNIQLRRPARFPFPSLRPKALPGTGGTAPLELAPQRVEPTLLHSVGFCFRYPELSAALSHEIGTEKLADAS